MSTESLKAMTEPQALRTLLSAYTLCAALGALQQEGKLKECRTVLTTMWKAATTDTTDLIHRHACELVVDQFFMRDGDMMQATARLWKDVERQFADTPLWGLLQNGLPERVEHEKQNMLEQVPQLVERIAEAAA